MCPFIDNGFVYLYKKEYYATAGNDKVMTFAAT